MNQEIHNSPEFIPDFSSLAFLSGEIQSTKYYVRNYQRNMQNKPNSPNVQIYINLYYIKDYQNFIPLAGYKNKPKTNPNKPNFRKAKMNVNLYVIEDYRKNDDFVVRINKPNFRNGQNERKLNLNKGLQKKRLFSRPKNKPNSNPIKACPVLAEALSAAEGAVEWANFKSGKNLLESTRNPESAPPSIDGPDEGVFYTGDLQQGSVPRGDTRRPAPAEPNVTR
jgi:hypothetical protein